MVYLIKIDTEGDEDLVLKGCKNTLNNAAFVFIECWQDIMFETLFPIKKDISHNLSILNELQDNFYPLRKFDQDILFVKKSVPKSKITKWIR